MAMIDAKEFSRLNLANKFKKDIELFTLITFFPYTFLSSDTTQAAPFLKASFIKLFPLFFFPLIAKNKLFFLIDRVSIESSLNLTELFDLVIFLILICSQKK